MKALTILASVAFFSFEMVAQQTIDITTGDVVDLATSTAPTRLVEDLDNGVRVTYTFDYARLDSVSSDSGNGAFIVSFNGFGLCEIPGRPALPSKLDAIEVPSAEDAVLTVETIDYSDYFFEIAPAVSPEPESSPVKTIASVAPISIPIGFYPAQQVEIVGSQNYYEKAICYFSVTPVTYDHVTKSVRIANKIVYTVSFGEAYASGRGTRKTRRAEVGSVTDDPVYSNVVLNAPRPSSGIEVTKDYLILTTSECERAVNKFADWKRALGFRTHISVGDNFVSDAIVKDTIETYLNKYHKTIKYLLLVGDSSSIAAFNREYQDPTENSPVKYLTDFYYQGIDTISDFDLLPYMYVGRIPASKNSEAENAFDKIMAYEKCNSFGDNFFNKGLHIAFFDNTMEDNLYDTRRFVCTSEEILTTARKIGIDPQRVYTVRWMNDNRPRYYSKSDIFDNNGAELPKELLSPDFNWIGTADEIKKALEDGVPYVLYRGHGLSEEWMTPRYSYDDILREKYVGSYLWGLIKNPTIYPVVFSIACLTGKYDAAKCFASTSILSKNRGSSCIIAASESGYSGHNDAFTLGMFDAFYPIPIKTTYITQRPEVYIPVYRIGQILTQGLCKMREKMGVANPRTQLTQEIFHCFGDPSMMIWCQEPTKFENVKINLDYNTLECKVTTGGELAYISFYDKNINNVKCFYGTEASFKFSQIHRIVGNGAIYGDTSSQMEYVVISAPNKIPIIQSSWSSDEQMSAVVKIENLEVFNQMVRVTYSCNADDDVKFIVTSVSTGKSRVVEQPKGEMEAVIDLSNEASGSYVITLVVNGNNVDSSTILIN